MSVFAWKCSLAGNTEANQLRRIIVKRNVAVVDVNYFWSLYLAVLHTANRQETSGRVRKLRHFENISRNCWFFWFLLRVNANQCSAFTELTNALKLQSKLHEESKSLKCSDVWCSLAVTDDDVSLGMMVQLKRDNWNCERSGRNKIEWAAEDSENSSWRCSCAMRLSFW